MRNESAQSQFLHALTGKDRGIPSEEWEKYQQYKKDKGPKIVIVRERIWESVLSDLFTFVTVAGVIGTGWLLSSTAMQWAGFLMLIIIAISRASNSVRKMTIAEARAKLDEWELRE